MARPLEQIEAEALELPEQARAKLVERLLRSFPVTAGMDAAVADEWLDEAERRDEAMDRGAESGAPAQEVLRRIERRRG
jgi:hypothetical protein